MTFFYPKIGNKERLGMLSIQKKKCPGGSTQFSKSRKIRNTFVNKSVFTGKIDVYLEKSRKSINKLLELISFIRS